MRRTHVNVSRNNALDKLLHSIGTCQRKVRYHTAIDADLDLARLWAHHKRNMVKYECQWCYQWHLAHGKWRDDR